MEKNNEVSFDSFYLGPPWLCRNNFEGGRRKRRTLLGSAPASRVFFQKESLCPSSSDPPPPSLSRSENGLTGATLPEIRRENRILLFLGGLVVSEIPFQEGPRRTPKKLGAEREWREEKRRGGNRISIPIPVASANPSDEKKTPPSSPPPPPAVKLFGKGGGRSQLAS